jgi:hypothetical protein
MEPAGFRIEQSRHRSFGELVFPGGRTSDCAFVPLGILASNLDHQFGTDRNWPLCDWLVSVAASLYSVGSLWQDLGTGHIVCHENASMAPNTTWTVRLTVRVTAPSGTVIAENAATLADTPDPNSANNTATASIKVQ